MREFAHQQNATPVPSGISVRILDTKQYAPPIAMIPRDAFYGFWELLHVNANDWNKFQLNRQRGTPLPVAPKFPLLSELADIEIENIDFSANQISELQAEIDAAQGDHSGRLQNEVLLTLSNAAIKASAENKGLRLSPFG
jgi:hypothetical protein